MELLVFIDGKVQGYSFCPPKKYEPTKQTFRCTKTLHGFVRNSERSDHSELANILRAALMGEHFGKGKETCESLGNFLDRRVETWEGHSSPKVQDLVAEEMWNCSSYSFKHKTTLRCAEHKANVFGNWIVGLLMF